ncbi:MAG: thiamine-phosphate kinase [Proteobacteria bacterium]|nr:thiamine-phosphate kinase [Pseudomonadota bacterium]
MKEFELIEKIFTPLTQSPQKTNHKTKLSNPNILTKFDPLNLQNDVAIIELDSKSNLVLSKDLMCEGVHFLKSDDGFKIASKLLLSNLSDIASSGATPLCYMLGFTKNNSLTKTFYTEFGRALSKIQNQYKIKLIGGDTSNSKSLHYSITIFGVALKDKLLLRQNAQNGDFIFVSNTVGDAFLGLNLKLKNSANLKTHEKKLLDKHFYPQPRIELSKQLVEQNLSKCATDISDGLIADLTNICNASKLNAQIFLSQIPISSSALKYLQTNSDLSKLDLLSGGDDYELIFSVDPKNIHKIQKLSKKLNLRLTCIGKFTNEKFDKKIYPKKFNVFLFNSAKNISPDNIINLNKKGYEHQ